MWDGRRDGLPGSIFIATKGGGCTLVEAVYIDQPIIGDKETRGEGESMREKYGMRGHRYAHAIVVQDSIVDL
jgi:hypothetical protein